MPDGFSFEDLKSAEHEGFSLEDVLKPAKKKPDHIGDLLREYDETGQKASGVAGRIIEAMRHGYREGFEGMPSLLSPEAQAKLDATQRAGGVKGAAANVASLAAEDVRAPFAVLPGLLRGGQAGVQQLGKEMGNERLGREVAAIPEAFPFGVGELGPASRGGAEPGRPPPEPPRARTEPTMSGGPRPALSAPEGFSLEEAGITPTPEPTPGAAPTAPKPGSTPLAEAGITPTPEPSAPAPAVETETVAVPQADGTVRQVQVKTGEPPPPGEPPAPTTAEAPLTGPVNPADLRAGFPDLSDEQFEALFQKANREVLRPTTNDPADQQGWMKSVMGVMARLAVPAAAEEQKPTRITSSQVQARDGVGAVEAGKRAAAENAAQEQQKPTDEWAPVAVAPIDQPDQETPIPQASTEAEPGQIPGKIPSTSSGETPSSEAPPPESTPEGITMTVIPSDPIEAHGGPWTPTGKQNHLGEPVFENPNGVRAIMDNGVPWTEQTKETDKGLVPKNPGNRKRQHLTTDEPWAEPIKKKTETSTRPAQKAEQPIKKPETAEKPKADWSLLGKNGDGQDVYANPQGVHSTLVDGIRTVEAVRLRPTPQGMAMSVPPPAEKAPQFQVVAPATETGPEVDQKGTESVPAPAEAHPDSTPAEVPIDEPPDELVGALNTLSGGRTQQTPTGEVPPAEEPPEELQGQSTRYKPRREYNKHLTNQAEIAANKLTVDALNGDIPEKNAVAALGELVRRGGLSEGAARVNLSRLNDWNEGEWEAAKSAPAEAPRAEEPAQAKPMQDDKSTTKERPSLGGTAKEIWDVWRDLRSPGGTFVVDGRGIGGEGTYFWRDGKLHRSFRFTAKSPAWYREATPAEEDEVWDAIEAGAFQITTHGPEGIAQKWSHDMPVQVNHQATGRPLPGTDAEKRLNAAMAEHAAQQRETEEEPEAQKKLEQPELAAEKDPVGTIKDFVRATLAGDTGVDAEPAVKALTAYSQTTPLSDHVVNRLSAFLGGEKIPKTAITRINNALGTNPTLDEWTAAVRAERSKSKAPNVESRAVAATHRASVAGDAEAKRLITAAHRARGERDRIRKDYADARNWTASDPQVKQIGGLAISRQRAFGLKHAHEAAVSAVRKADADIAEYGKALSNQAPSGASK